MTKTKNIKTQKQLDSVNLNFTGEIAIIGGTIENPITLNKNYENAVVVLKNNAVVNMYGNSTVKNMYGNSTVKNMYGISTVKNMTGDSRVKNMYGNSTVKNMTGNSRVKNMHGNSAVNYMFENSTVNYMYENSVVNYMYENSEVNYLFEDSRVKNMYENSTVKNMLENSIVKNMYGNSTVRVYSQTCNINCLGFNFIFVDKEITDFTNIKLNKTSQIILFDTFKTNQSIDFYLKQYNIKKKDDKTLIMYKAVHKSSVEGEYFSDYDKNFIYKIGETKIHETSTDISSSCKTGLHVSDLRFAKLFSLSWLNLAIIEVEVPINKVVISKDCNGKIRTSELKVIRELDKSEY